MSTTYDPTLLDDGSPVAGTRLRPGPTRQILVVGDAAFVEEMRAVLRREGVVERLSSVSDFLEALGEAGTDAPAVVIGRVRDLRDPLDSTVRGLRRLLPSAMLLLVVPPDEEPAAIQAVRLGFNDYLIEPVDERELSGLVRVGLQPVGRPVGLRGERFPAAALAPADDVGQTAAPIAKPAEPAALPERPLPVDPPRTARAIAPASPLPPGAEAAAGAAIVNRLTVAATRAPLPEALREPLIASAAPASAVPDADLGDIDLINRLLADTAGMGDLPLRVVAGRSEIAGLTFAPAPNGPPPGHASAEVVYEGQTLGRLCAPPPASPDDLAPWAHWMGHWVSLDQRLTQLRLAAFKDELTGAWNWRYFRQFLAAVLDRAVSERFCVTLLLFDIDDFKTYNDRYGHCAGDEILRETARLMQTVVRPHDVVARVGGDEFAVIFWDATEPRKPNSRHPQSVRRATRRFREAIAKHQFPKLRDAARGSLTISGGIAGFPWDGRTPDALIEIADARALESKRQGKNALTFGPGAEEEGDGEEEAG
ncbi:MAG: diguanylate cyclase [Planctomycetota bacterium]|nr:diguanylate cyclase [Planctomycetota bacterium]